MCIYFVKFNDSVATFLRNHAINMSFGTTNTLGSFTKNNNKKFTQKSNRECTYKLHCGSCEVYVGQSGHRASYINEKPDSNYAFHLNNISYQ